MAFITSFTYCNEVHTIMTPQGPQIQIGAQLRAITPFAIPGNFTFSIVCDISDLNPDENNKMQIKFEAPDESILYDTGVITVPTKTAQGSKMNAVQFNLEMRNVIFKLAGIYTTKIYVNNEELGAYKIRAIAVGDKK